VHSNAGGGKGCEFFTSHGVTASDAIATIFGEAYQIEFPDRALRSNYLDGDLDKERRFYVLMRTKMPAILTENFFMDNFDEFKEILNTREGRQKIINYHIKAILRVDAEIFSP
jgi:N-acetylmuramoyl-L-alanine amidase